MKTRGFTLVELMVVVAIIGVLASIAYPAYIDYLVRTRRAVATGCLTELSQFMERWNTTYMRYDEDNSGNAIALPACNSDLAGFYTISFAAAPGTSTFTLQAVPQGVQATRDTRCGTLTLNQVGVKTESGSASSFVECWQ